MTKGKEMFEAIEMHVERMLAKRSEQEKFENPALTKHERQMQKLLERLRKMAVSEEMKPEKAEDSSAHV